MLGTIEFLHGLVQGSEYEAEIEAGKRLLLGISSIGDADRHGMRTVMCTLNGQFRPIQVRDRSVVADVKSAEKADPTASGQVAAPFAGVVTLAVGEGDVVEAGGVVATIEAMKMEASITRPAGGTVTRVAIGAHQQVEGGDYVVNGRVTVQISRKQRVPRSGLSCPLVQFLYARDKLSVLSL